MQSFRDPDRTFAAMPARLGVVLNRVDISSGREELYENQLPELLLALAEQTKVESIRASNAIEGVEVGEDRAEPLARADKPKFRNRSEKEFAGYADALDSLMRDDKLEPPTVPLLLRFHRQMLAHTEARGGHLKQDDNLIADRDKDGTRRIIFKPPPHTETETLLIGLCGGYGEALSREIAHPLALLAAFIVDLLAIHPVIDGNGRVSRLAMTHELLRLKYGVARYVSIEQRIYDSRNSYYTALKQSQRQWHEEKHSIWPFAEYLASVMDGSYEDFENRVAAAKSQGGLNKQDRVRRWVLHTAPEQFRFRDVRRAVPGVSDPTIRLVLRALREEGKVSSTGTGPGARWSRVGSG